MTTILVAYASKNGSTREVAEAVAAQLGMLGFSTEARPARDVRTLDGYDAIVFGGALYYFKLVSEGRKFLARHAAALAEKPVAVFGMGPIEQTEQQYQGARDHLDSSLAPHGSVHPAAVTVFGGAFDARKAAFPESLMMKKFPATDLRDWAMIEAWTASLPAELGLT